MVDTRRAWCYYSGLDLGQAHQHTALAVLEKVYVADEDDDRLPEIRLYSVRHLERFPPGTPYAEVFGRVRALYADTPLSGTSLVVDRTGVGKPVIDLLEGSGIDAEFRSVAITSGQSVTYDGGTRLVPRKELVGVMQVMLQGRRLKFAESLPDAATLVRELTNFQAKVTAAADAVLEWREGTNDDLVLAVAIAAWEGERHRPDEGGEPMVLGERFGWHRRWYM